MTYYVRTTSRESVSTIEEIAPMDLLVKEVPICTRKRDLERIRNTKELPGKNQAKTGIKKVSLDTHTDSSC